MTLYVDDARIPAEVAGIVARWSHLTADSRGELDVFAARLGLRPQWIQYPGTCLEHYDLTDSKRRLALRLGAIAITQLRGRPPGGGQATGPPFRPRGAPGERRRLVNLET